MNEDLFRKRLRRAAGLVVVVATAGGIYLDWKSFTINLAASAIAAVAGVLLVFLVVERLLEQRRRDSWAIVERPTLAATRADLIDASLGFFRVIFAHPMTWFHALLEGRDVATEDALQVLRLMGVEAAKYPNESRAEELHDGVAWALAHIRDVLTPRVIAIGSDPELVEVLVRLDVEESRWKSALIAQGETGGVETYPKALCVLIAIGDAYAAILVREGARPAAK